MWHIDADGIAPIRHKASGAEWFSQWRPWPGESVSFKITKPSGVFGQSLTVDSSSLTVEPLNRGEPSRGCINGAPEALHAGGRNLTIPVTPRAQTVEIKWRQATGISTRFSSDPIDLYIDSTNHAIEMNIGNDRWTLLTFAPSLGPAVRF